MSDSQGLLSRIVALRQRLEHNPVRSNPPSLPAVVAPSKAEPGERIQVLEREVEHANLHSRLLDTSLRQVADTEPTLDGDRIWPSRLTLRSRRLLERGQDLVNRLRPLCEEPILTQNADDPLAVRLRQTVAMTDAALRTIQAFPDAPSVQLRLGEGLEGILDDVTARLAGLTAALERRRHDSGWIDRLADLLHVLTTEERMDIKPFLFLAEEILAEAKESAPISFLCADATNPKRFVAAHSLVVAQVMARLAPHDEDLRDRPLEAVLAGLLHDAGMLRIPAEILTQPSPLTDAQRRTIESHTRLGSDMMQRLWPAAGWLAEAALGHHERLDGTGYPNGLRDAQIPTLNRLLAVCDVYAALCLPRAHRPAVETRTALTDTLLLAEQGQLDSTQAERLLSLSFYPVGSVVELTDGTLALVVATAEGRRDVNHPARPVVMLLTDAQGSRLPIPRHLDLSQVEGHGIVRSLSGADRQRLLAKTYPEAA
jgi:HD-GYP domain-containing protein (c-di-GMP phosphodiesterase class II)